MKQPSNKQYLFLIYAALALATLLTFQHVRHNDFVNYDDIVYVTDEPLVTAGLTRDGIVWALTKHHAGTWHPLTSMSHMLDCQLFDLNAGAHHLTSLLLHIVNTILLFSVFRRATGALWPSAFVAAAFALHPLHVESVAWISERKDVLSTLFWLLTMTAYLRYVNRPRTTWYLLALLAFALGLMAKPMVVTLPFVLLLLDYWPLGRFQSDQPVENSNRPDHESVNTWFRWPVLYRLVREKVPFFVLSAIFSVLTFLTEHSIGTIGTTRQLPLMTRIFNALVSYVTYIGKMVWPSRLAVFYPHPATALPIWQAVAAALLLLAVSLCVLYTARRRGYLLVGWLWYLGTLLPVIGLVQIGFQALADRYTYIPLTGLFIIIAWGLPDALINWRYRKIALGISAAVVLSALMICTSLQVRHWRNSFTLFEHALNVTGGSYVAHKALGDAKLNQGRIDEAIMHYEAIMRSTETLTVDPCLVDAHYNLAIAFARQGSLNKAVEHYTQALRVQPTFPEAHYNLGKVFADQGRLDEAIAHYTQALRFKSDYTDAHYNLAIIFADQGGFDQAVSHYTEALRLDPNHAGAHNNLGVLFARQGQIDKAVVHFNEVLRLKPEFAAARRNLAAALAALGRFDDAIEQYSWFLQFEPGDADAHNKLGTLLSQQGNSGQAITHFTEALGLRPDWPEVLNNLAWLLATRPEAEFHNPAKAIQLAERACELTNYNQPVPLDTLAAAYAAAGQFPRAIENAEKAVKLALSAGRKNMAQEIQSRIQLYKSRQPYHAPAPVRDNSSS